ncbi:retrotransposon protein, putative, ty1-copia subclass [Tanacetum coccineum]
MTTSTTSVGLSNKDKEKYPEKPILAALYCAPDQQSLLRAMTIIGVELKALYSKQAEQELLQNLMREFTCAAGGGHSRRRNALLLCLSYMKRTLPKKVAAPAFHAIKARKVQKNKNKNPSKAAKGVQGKDKGKKAYANAKPSYAPKPKNPPPLKKDNPSKDAICHHCGKVGFGTHICNITEGLQGCKKPNPGVLSLYMGNGQRAVVEAIEIIIYVSLVDYAILRDGVYEIEMSCSNTNDSSIKKRIEKLQHDGLLNSTNIESLGKCVSCMSGKMAKKPYSHQSEKVFETFKVFQKEVENQLRKTIKSLRSNRGGEYMSQEFLNHLKEHGIIAYRTPPYTPQHNGVSERRNRTLLDMVRSMMSQTTLPKSFWDYALESAAHILNRVPAKKVDKTPYEIWYGQAPKAKTVDISAIRILIAIAAFYDYEIRQMDVKTTFLNEHLSKEVYMTQPEGEAAYILRIKIYRDRSKWLIGLCKSAYIEKILKRYYIENSKHGTIPMQEKLKLSKSDGASTPAEKRRMSNVPYALAVGSIMYAVRCTRPDVAFAQNITSQFQQNLGELYWTNVKNILKYLQNTKDIFLVYVGVLIEKSTKQSIFATSSTYAEYIAAFDASKEAVWIRKFISGLNVVPTIEEPITMYCDNTRAIAIANDHGVTKGA